MELIVKEVTLPEALEFNYEELKKELTQRVSEYKTVVYTADTIKTAKADRSSLNKLKTSLNNERIRLEQEYMAPFMDFKNKISELCGIIDEAASCVDKQVKEFEKLQKENKQNEICKIFDESLHIDYPWLNIQLIWNEKWLNASYKIKQITEELSAAGDKIKSDLDMLSRLPEYSFEAQESYKKSLSLDQALFTADDLKQMAEAKRRMEYEAEQLRKEQEAAQAAMQAQEPAQIAPQAPVIDQNEPAMAEPNEIWFEEAGTATAPTEPQREWLSFRVLLSMEEAMMLNQFFKLNQIVFEKI